LYYTVQYLSTEGADLETLAGVLYGQLGVELGAGVLEVDVEQVGAEQVVLNHLKKQTIKTIY